MHHPQRQSQQETTQIPSQGNSQCFGVRGLAVWGAVLRCGDGSRWAANQTESMVNRRFPATGAQTFTPQAERTGEFPTAVAHRISSTHT